MAYRAVQLWLISATAVTLATAGSECSSCGLLVKGVSAPAITIGDGISVRLRPLNAVKTLRLNVLLEDDKEQELYELEINENMDVVWGDMEVTLRDSKSHSNVLKVPWPPILVSRAWTTLFLRLHYHHLLQLAAIPHEAFKESRSFVHSQILLQPAAISTKLERFGVTKMRLKLLSSNISIEYTADGGEEHLATAFASQFGIGSTVPFWRSLAWIMLGVIGMLIVILAFTFVNIYLSHKKQPNSFTLAWSQTGGKEGTAPGPVMVSSTHGGKQKDGRGKGDKGTLNLPRVTVGVVSSRAPSPGHEVDENTLDYVNKAFCCDED
ncbi:uncharacterized protein LOC126999742 [Eriocheir sinensis]|uniref:uncharacterized protein LOC126999742 n=1 Tax=Eriocheir sinensis TaxID=95602 RepID=UPI0021C5B05A|nr:uncharacterized protein LOC126999742 [Eriocheir sinensis]